MLVAEEYGGPPKPSIDLSKLPSAPRASRGVDIDLSKLPPNPPYTAFLGNLPFETDEEDIVNLFRGLKVCHFFFLSYYLLYCSLFVITLTLAYFYSFFL